MAQADPGRRARPSAAAPAAGCTLATLTAATRRPADPAAPGEERYACQATELLRAAPERIPPWDATQYVQDVRSGNAGALAMIRTLAVGVFNEYQDASRRLPPAAAADPGRPQIPVHRGPPPERRRCQTLGLQPGERVRVKRREEIVATLDVNNANRGMSFDGEMLRYCGQEARVLRRVERIIDEKSGRMLRLKNPCIVLDDVICTAAYHRQCPRGIYPYWREIWLERSRVTAAVRSARLGRARHRRGRERGPHGQPLRRHAAVVDVRQLEQPQHLAGLGPPSHP